MTNTKYRMAAMLGLLLGAMGTLWAGPRGTPSQTEATRQARAVELDARALAELELAHSRARDELLAVESRLSLLTEKLFDSRLVVYYRGTLETPYRLASIQLWLDGALAYRQAFERAPTAQALKLFDGFVSPGRHVVEVRIRARGPGEADDGQPGFFAGSGMAVHLRNQAVTRVEFEAEQDGDAPDLQELKSDQPDGGWQVEIEASFATEPS